jgi:hypothetical protein
MLQRERPRGVRLGIEVEAEALLSTSGMQAYPIALERAEEASGDEMARDWSVVAATIARRSGRRAPLLDALYIIRLNRRTKPRCKLLIPRPKSARCRGRAFRQSKASSIYLVEMPPRRWPRASTAKFSGEQRSEFSRPIAFAIMRGGTVFQEISV